MLSQTEIAYNLKKFGINLPHDKFLQNPDQETMDKIYMQIIQQIFKVQNDDFHQICYNGLEYIQGEMEEHGSYKVNIFNSIKKLMDVAGVQDFNLFDIVYPDQKKTQKILSQLVKFMQVEEFERQFFNGQILKIQDKESLIQKLKENAEEIQENYNNFLKQKEIEKPEFDKLTQEIQREELLEQELKNKIRDLQSKLDSSIQEKNKQEKENSQELNQIAQLEKDIQNLRDKIVQSPQKLQEKYRILEEDLNNQENIQYNLEGQIQNLDKKLAQSELYFNSFQTNILNPFQKLTEQIDNKKQCENHLQELDETNKQLEDSYSQLLDEIDQLNKEIFSLKEKIEEINNQNKDKTCNQEEKLKELLNEQKQVEQKAKLLDDDIQEIKQIIHYTKEKKQEKENYMEIQYNQHDQFMDYMIEKIEEYNNFINQTIKQIAQRQSNSQIMQLENENEQTIIKYLENLLQIENNKIKKQNLN
ncbi:hypothetical protein PPERSA_12111 [Pseudocohnilembus persalinus]|uniref:Kinetochore protein Nuf2 N-terminal domain-containing protein n=1 Tax=Pseudocohnilembus persalinus TaxID=266149 RepID=A0A0V0QNR1_PSEPJ|nr:hypothetical protein PPERSA_12111 [Pseudocohnilembus persalinus]|eukprot:KRX03906.1 hypothetical protein PPERSA_12111 [Pseudocohnilembus persalinus]